MLRIRSADNSDFSHISRLCSHSVLGTKIMCQIGAYGLDKSFFSVWLCTDSDEILGIICKLEDDITLIYSSEENTEDIRTSVDMIGYSSVCCTYEMALKLEYECFTTKKAYFYAGKHIGEMCDEITENHYRDAYSLICRNIPGSFSDTKEAYLSFLSDFTYRRRRGMARIKGFTERNEVISCALTSAETEQAAIISGVACDSMHRKSGLGKNTVLSLAEELHKENKTVYVIALNESAEGFYEHIGFEFKEKISFIERK
ncbi:MAG: GNAT family N-acetyltransferase [Clostridia bacterium]|nr:GNAT family N-acetyltransferase [Clostridia bacterium]